MKRSIGRRILAILLAGTLVWGLGFSAITPAALADNSQPAYVPGEVFTLADSLEEANEIAAGYGLELKSYAYGVAVFSASDPEATVRQSQRARSSLPKLSLNRLYQLFETTPATPSAIAMPNYTVQAFDFPLQYHHAEMETELAWGLSTGEGVLVAVIDTGIDTDHPEFAGRISADSYNAHTNEIGLAHVEDTSGHGTHVAGIIAASNSDSNGVSGIAPDVELLVIKASDSSNQFSTDVMIVGINYAVAHGADIINISFGLSYSFGADDSEQKAIADAVVAGVTVICAAGNSREANAAYPAAYEDAIAVSGLKQGLEFDASYSNYGSQIDISAPGTDVYSTAIGGGYGTRTGTSMAAPTVAGVAALIKSINPDYTPDDIRAALCNTAADKGTTGLDEYYGWGAVNAYAAVNRPVIVTSGLENGVFGTLYTQTLAATGGMQIVWSCQEGLPPGTALSPEGILSGEPGEAGTFIFTVKAANGAGNDTAEFSVTISKAAQTTPAAPTQAEVSAVSVTLTEITGAEYGVSTAPGAWQDEALFEGLSPNTTYYFFARMKETATHSASPESPELEVTTAKLAGVPAPDLNYDISDGDFPKTVTITAVSGAEYSFDGGANWSDTNTHISEEDEDIVIAIRIKETDTHEASQPAFRTVNTATQTQAPPDAFKLTYDGVNDETYIVTIPETSGAEYSFDGTTWSGTSTKSGALPGDTLTGYKRMASKPGYDASANASDTITLPLFQVKKPTASPNGSTFSGTQSVTLASATTDAIIYYTTDGSTPSDSATPYTGAFTLSATATVKAIAVKANMADSEILSVTFKLQALIIGGGGGTAPPDTTLPVNDGLVSVSYTQSGGDVTINLGAAEIKEIIGKPQAGKAVFDLSEISDATSAILPAKALTELANADLGLGIYLPRGTVALDESALSDIAAQIGGANASFTVKTVDVSGLNTKQREPIKDGDLVFDISITSANTEIHNFDGLITVSIPYAGKTPLAVWFLSDGGELEKLECTYSNGNVIFSLPHLSLYVLGYDPEAELAPWLDNPFIDAVEGNWFLNDVKYVFTKGLFNGTSATTFSPQSTMTRGMVVTVLWRMDGEPLIPDVETYSDFTDVAEDSYYELAVAWAAKYGLVKGYGNSLFGPDDAVTREQLATILWNYAKMSEIDVSIGEDTNILSYEDAFDISEYAVSALQWACGAGIINGTPDGYLNPQGNATRAEVAAVLHRFMEAAL